MLKAKTKLNEGRANWHHEAHAVYALDTWLTLSSARDLVLAGGTSEAVCHIAKCNPNKSMSDMSPDLLYKGTVPRPSRVY